MASQKIIDKYKEIDTLIDSGNIRDVFLRLSADLDGSAEYRIKDLLNRNQETYKYLIHYMVEGFSDPSRKRMLSEIQSTLHFINDCVRRSEVIVDSSDIYSSTLRFLKVRKSNLQSLLKDYRDNLSVANLAATVGGDLESSRKTDESLSSIFSYVWTMFGSETDDYRLLLETVKDPDMPFGFKAQIVSALLLGNLEYFDRKGFMALLDIIDSDLSPALTSRAMTAVVFIMNMWPNRVKKDPTIADRLSLWQDSIVVYRQLREIVMSIMRAHDTQRISTKMKNEVLPELMKLQPEILKRLGKVSGSKPLESIEANPEWEEILEKNGLGDKLRELTDMQMDGGDVMMMAFSNLKEFPFFNNISNWFLPFSISHSEVLPVADKTGTMFRDLLDSGGVMCDSDKYSFIFSLAHMPEQQRKIVNEQMEAQMSQLREAMEGKMLKSTLPEFDQETTRYVRDLYRFFKLYKKKGDFQDPFEKPLDFYSIPYIGEILGDSEILRLAGEFYFKRGYYREALPMLIRLDEDSSEEGGDPLLWEKIGYCHMQLGELDKAIVWFRKSELLHPESKWLIKQLALCHRLLQNYTEAAEYYLKALASDPENYHLLVNAGHALLETGDYAGALSHYYHADYIKPGRAGVKRALAWAELLNGNIEKSIDMYSALIETPESNATDHLNAGHAYFLKRDYKKALQCYIRAARHEGYGLKSLEDAIEEDLPVIKRGGGDIEDLRLLFDRVRYDI